MVKLDKKSNRYIWGGYDIEITAEPAMNKNRDQLIKQITEMVPLYEPTQTNLLVWKLLAKANFPNAESILQTLQEQVDQQMQMEQAQVQQEQEIQNSPQGKLLNSIVQKVGGQNVNR
jgi:hypothetical protein